MTSPLRQVRDAATQSPGRHADESVDPQLPSRPAMLLIGIVVASVVAMLIALPLAFFVSYFMNDLVTWHDHLRFTWVVCGAVLASGALNAAVARAVTRLPLRRCLGSALATSAFMPLLLGSIYALLNVSPVVASAVGSTASNATCVLLFVALGVTSAAALATGVRLLVVVP